MPISELVGVGGGLLIMPSGEAATTPDHEAKFLEGHKEALRHLKY